MNFKKLIFLTFLIFPFTFLSSCGGDEEKQADPEPAPAVMKCLPNERYQDTARWRKHYYNADGLTVKTDSRDGNRLNTTTNVYNSKNQLVEQTYVQTNGTSYSQSTYTYNTFGRWQTVDSKIKQNNVLIPWRTVSYNYSSTGQLQRKDENIHYPASSSGYTTYSFTNNLVTANSYTAAGVLYWIEEYEFDNNKVVSADVTSTIYDNEFWIPHNIIRYTLKFPNGGVDFQRSYTALFTFNSDGYPVQRVEKDPNGDVRWTETYTYNCQ